MPATRRASTGRRRRAAQPGHAALARLLAAAVAVRPERAEVPDDLAVVQLPRPVELHPHDVVTGAAVDRAAAVVSPDVIVAGAAVDLRWPVARVQPIGAGAASQDVALRGRVALGIPVAPADVAAG